jgi:hypothetical protein
MRLPTVCPYSRANRRGLTNRRGFRQRFSSTQDSRGTLPAVRKAKVAELAFQYGATGCDTSMRPGCSQTGSMVSRSVGAGSEPGGAPGSPRLN